MATNKGKTVKELMDELSKLPSNSFVEIHQTKSEHLGIIGNLESPKYDFTIAMPAACTVPDVKSIDEDAPTFPQG